MTVTVWLDLWRETVVVRRRFASEPAGGAEPMDGGTATQRYLAHCQWLIDAEEHPVVDVVHRDDKRRIMSTRFVGAALASATGLPPGEAAQLLASLARALARLHACGLVHGNLCADHILLGRNRFWLCSPATQPVLQSTDVAAFGPLVGGLVSNWERSETAPRMNHTTKQRWHDLATMAADRSMSAARLAMRADRLC